MKKMIALMMALAIMASFAACGGKKTETENNTTVPTTEQVVEDTTGEVTDNETTAGNATIDDVVIDDSTSALDVLDRIWIGMGAERQPAVYGGHISAEYMHGPYTYELTYAEDLAATLLLPEDQMDSVTDAATVVHMLNANSMTAGVVKLGEGADVKAFADATAERISGNQWMCGFPEKMVVIQINDEFLFVAYGLVELIDPMVEGMDKNWSMNELYNKPLE